MKWFASFLAASACVVAAIAWFDNEPNATGFAIVLAILAHAEAR